MDCLNKVFFRLLKCLALGIDSWYFFNPSNNPTSFFLIYGSKFSLIHVFTISHAAPIHKTSSPCPNGPPRFNIQPRRADTVILVHRTSAFPGCLNGDLERSSVAQLKLGTWKRIDGIPNAGNPLFYRF